MQWPEFKGMTCVVTGAGGGIGRRISLDLARAGAKLMLLDASEERCQATRQEAQSMGASCEAAVLDLTNRAALQEAAAQSAAAFGAARVLISTIAISGRPDALIDLDLAKWQRQIDVNLTSYFSTAQVFAHQMRDAGGGSIVHVGSLAGQFPQPNSGAYSTCKAGVAMLSRVMALEWGAYNIRSNVVSPAMVRTPLSERLYQDPDVLARRTAMVPLGHVSDPEQISQAVMFLASERANYVTGQDLLVDGGLSQKLMGLMPVPAAKP